LDHPLGDAPNNAGLAAGGGSGDDLRAGLILAAEAIQQDGGSKGALRVLPSDCQQGAGEAALPGGAITEAEQVDQEPDLRRIERDRRRLPFALDVRQLFDEVANIGSGAGVESERALAGPGSLEVAEVAPRCQQHQSAVLPALPVLRYGAG